MDEPDRHQRDEEKQGRECERESPPESSGPVLDRNLAIEPRGDNDGRHGEVGNDEPKLLFSAPRPIARKPRPPQKQERLAWALRCADSHYGREAFGREHRAPAGAAEGVKLGPRIGIDEEER